ncbi:MAG: tail fiber domain-containing protein, partial [Candidatus Yanofskybacteria bacterium]|nr:tail fiber domain-containing protein [Candidatus Yanofskybacteria bacterium]
FEVQGTASASYLLTGNTLQVGGYASAAYSRFGTTATTHSNYISTIDDLLISGDLEGRASITFAGTASLSNTLWASPGGYSGNVGIGTTAPDAKLAVRSTGSTSQAFLNILDSNATQMLDVISDSSGNAVLEVRDTSGNIDVSLNTGGVSFLNGGNVGIGTTVPVYKQHIWLSNAGTDPTWESSARAALLIESGEEPHMVFFTPNNQSVGIDFADPESAAAGQIVYNHSTNAMQFNTNGAAALFINSAGNVGIGDTGPTEAKLVVGDAGAGDIYATFATANTETLCWDASGASLITDCSSLSKFKENVQDLSLPALETLMKLKPREYDWIGKEEGIRHDLGFVAEEVNEISPLLASYNYDNDGVLLLNGVKYERMSALLTKGIQELNLKIASLSAQVVVQNQNSGDSGTINISSILSGVLGLLKDSYHLVIEDGVIKAVKFIADTIEAREIKASEKICIDDVCVSKDQLKALLSQTQMTNEQMTSQIQSSNSQNPISTTTTTLLLGNTPAAPTASASETESPIPQNVLTSDVQGTSDVGEPALTPESSETPTPSPESSPQPLDEPAAGEAEATPASVEGN